MNVSLLKEIIIEQNPVDLPSHVLPRHVGLQIPSLCDNPFVVVITGIRRCGKSTLLQMIRQHNTVENSYYLNFDDDRLVSFQLEDFQNLLESFIELYGEQKICYFDEIQNIEGWEHFVRRLHNQHYKVYITGSNATLFSSELGTRLTGRYIALTMYPLSFSEFAVSFNTIKAPFTTVQKGLIKQQFNQYLTLGGFPEYIQSQQSEYLHSLYDSLLYRDIIVRYHITNDRALKELVYYLASNASKEVSYNTLRKILGIASASTISDYCSYLAGSFLCFFVYRFDYSLKKQMLFNKKVYFVDHVLAKHVGFRISQDKGRLLENIVFMELKRRYAEIYFHRQKKECDFLIRDKGTIIAAYQVCLTLEDENTWLREKEGLLEAMQTYHLTQGFILTENEQGEETIQYDNESYRVIILSVAQWLMDWSS